MYYSQFGEDRYLSRLFAGKTTGICVEVGANNGVDGSTTLYFENRGWTCVLVEPNPELCDALRTRRSAQVFECAASSVEGVATLHIAIGDDLAHAVSSIGGDVEARQVAKRHGFATRPIEVKTRRLDDMLAEANLSRPIDFMSIDVEGHEIEALKGFTPARWKPTVIIVEDNSAVWEIEVSSHLRAHGYVRFHRTGVNDWYAHQSNRDLTNLGRRLRYIPAMLAARVFMFALRGAERVFRLPGLRGVRRQLRGLKR